jgi:hypothetical protein
MKRACVIAVLLFLSAATTSSALTINERRGLIFGLGIGASALTWSQTYDDGEIQKSSESETVIPLCTDIRLGFCLPNNRVMIYYWNKFNWFRVQIGEDTYLSWNGLHALAGSYFFKGSVPSAYLTLGIGLASWQPWISNYIAYGLGASAGVGYEFNKHLCIEAAILFSRPSNEYLLGNITTNTIALSLCIIAILY